MGRVIIKLTRVMVKPTYGLPLLFHFCILQKLEVEMALEGVRLQV